MAIPSGATNYLEITSNPALIAAAMPDDVNTFACDLVIDEAEEINWEGGAATFLAGLAADYSDLRVTDVSGDVEIAFGVKAFSQTTGSRRLVLMLGIPATAPLSASAYTVYRLWRGCTGGQAEDRAGVVPTADGYLAYWPMTSGGATVEDWTANGYDATNNGCTAATGGPLGVGALEWGGDDWLSAAVALASPTTMTVSLWLCSSQAGGWQSIVHLNDSMRLRSPIYYALNTYLNGYNDYIWTVPGGPPYLDAWGRLVWRQAPGVGQTLAWDDQVSAYTYEGEAAAISTVYVGVNGASGQYYTGAMAELMISSVCRSLAWETTAYNSQHSPGTFWAVGAEQSAEVPPETVALASIAAPLVDVAEMSDGTVWVACWDAEAPLVRLESWTRAEVARCNGMVLSRISGEVAEVAAPEGAGEIDGVGSLHPDGWALAISGETMQIWQYLEGAWTLIATGPGTGGSEYSPQLCAASGELWVLIGYGGIYHVRGSAIVGPVTDITSLPAMLREYVDAQGVRTFWEITGSMLSPETQTGSLYRFAMDRWRGRWCGCADGCVGAWDGQGLVTMADAAGRGVVVGAARRLHLFGRGGSNRVFADAWYCYGGGAIAEAEIGNMRITAGHATSARTWLLGEYWRSLEDGGEAYNLLRIDDIELVAPAVYEERQGAGGLTGLRVYEARQRAGADASGTLAVYELRQRGGGDATAASPEVYEVRQGADGLARVAVAEVRQGASNARMPALRVYELRQRGGGDATATLAVYEARQRAGGDASAASPEIYEARQGASCPMPIVRIYEARQWAHTDGGPTGGELVRFVVVDGDDQATAALVDCGPGASVRVLMRGEPAGGVGAAEVDSWGTYQAVEEGCREELETPGARVRVAVIKGAEAAVPEVKVMVKRDPE